MVDFVVFVLVEVIMFVGSGEFGFYDDVGIKVKMINF